MANIPLWLKILLYLGGAALVWSFLGAGLKRLMSWLLVAAVNGAHAGMMWVLGFPLARAFVVKNKDHIVPILDAFFDGLEAISNAVQKAIEDDIAAAQVPPADADPNDPRR